MTRVGWKDLRDTLEFKLIGPCDGSNEGDEKKVIIE